ncbi:MAG: hypothetical protein ACM3N4_03755 [Nitrososphaerota archaeon]
MHPQQPHFPQQNDPTSADAPSTLPTQPAHGMRPHLPPLPPLDDAEAITPPATSTPSTGPARSSTLSRASRPTRPPVRRTARPTRPIHPPTLPGLEDEVRTVDASVRSEIRSLALAPIGTPGALTPGSDENESTALLIPGAAKPPRPAARVVPRRNGPRSFLMQFLVAMLASVVLVSTLTLATPLGQSVAAATNGQFGTSSGAFVPLPTATPTATPKPRFVYPSAGIDPGKQAVINDIIAVFGSAYAQGALNIASCESGYDPNARNSYPIGNSHASGVFQILYPSTWDTTSYAAYSPFDYDKNIHAAYEIFRRDGYSWREWQCKPY